MPLKLQVDADAIAAQFKEFAEQVKEDMKKAMSNLSTITKARIVDLASKELKSSREIYIENLSEPDQSSPGVWVISLDQPALWIEEGIAAGKDMKPDLLKGAAYKVIPFRYDKPTSQNTSFTQGMINQIKQNLRKKKIPFKTIEYNKDGSARVGKLHEMDLGGPRPGKGNTPALSRLSIYQSEKNGKVKRDILTFRTVTRGPKSEGKWIHPGSEPKKFMDKAMDLAIKDWEEKILPEIMAAWGK